MGIHRINWIHRYATTGAFIGEKEYWGKGYGTDAKMHLLEYAFHTLNLHKMCSSVYAFNERSVKYSLRCGYKIEGTRKQHVFRNGQYWDLIELGLLYEDWKPIWEQFNQEEKGGDNGH
jgi:RimJ/RimL family protein N-acetyltransferase